MIPAGKPYIQPNSASKIIDTIKKYAPHIAVGFLAVLAFLSSKGERNMRIHFLNVGDGHCTLLELPNGEHMLIDVFNNNDNYVIEYLKDLKIDSIEYLVITHPHADHLRGITELYNNFDIGEVWYVNRRYYPPEYDPRHPDDEIEFKNYYRKVKEIGVPVHKDDEKEIGDVHFKVLNPSKTDIHNSTKSNEDINNLSIVLLIKYGEFIMIIPGDNQSESWEKIIKRHKLKLPELGILLASHHGHQTGYNLDFIKAVSPKHLIISSNKKKSHDAWANYNPHVKKKIHTTRNDGDIVFDCSSEGDCRRSS